MLQKLRSSSAGLVAKAFMVLLIISFGAWGIQGYLRETRHGEVVATVGNETISSQELAANFARDVRRFQAQGSNVTAEQARNMGLMDVSLNQLIQGRLFDEAANWLDMGVSDNLIAQTIRKEKIFQDESGTFSRSRYEMLLRNNGTTEGRFVADLRRDTIRRQIINSLAFTSGAPTILEKRLHLYQDEKRVATMAVVPVDDKLDVGTPDDATIEKIHKDQADRYTAPERRDATYVLLTLQNAMKEVVVADDELHQYYDENQASYTTPEMRTVQQIRFKDEETARKAAAMIGEGRTFESVAKQLANVEGDALTYGTFATGNFPIESLAGTIDSLGVGQVSEPVKTDFGWHLFRVSKITPKAVKPFDEVRGEIEDTLKAERAGQLLYNMSTHLEDELAGGSTLEKAAEILGVETHKTGLVDIEGKGKNDKAVEGLPGDDFLNTVFVTGQGEQSSVQQLSNGNYYVVRVDEIVPSAVRPVDEVKGEIIANWQADKRKEAARQRALAIVDRIEKGEHLTDISKSEGLDVTESKPFTRQGEGAKSDLLTPVLVSDMFRLKPGQAAMADADQGFVVAELKSIQTPGLSEDKQLATAIGNQMTGDILQQLDAALRKKFGVDVDETAIAQMPLPQ